MYVCLCAGVNDSTIIKAIENGCRNLKQIKLATGAMTGCCKCCNDCKELLRSRTTYDIPNEEDEVCHS